MTHHASRSLIGIATIPLAVLAIAAPLFAQPLVSVDTPGGSFVPEGRGANVAIDTVAGGRRFRGAGGSRLIVRGVVQTPDTSADLKMERLTTYFRTSPGGPRLRAVELRNGSNVAFRMNTDANGNYVTRETTAPASAANVWVLPSISVRSQFVIRLEIQFPIGIDSAPNPSDLEFVLTTVRVDFSGAPKIRPCADLSSGCQFSAVQRHVDGKL
ncbi:MAG: hypothetical protein ABL996_24175, partial [Micropepsaceae bacterium]